MNKTKILVMLSLFVILMTVFGNVLAQDSSLPAFKVSTVETDVKVVLTTKNFPADTAYTISMASAEDPENFTPVAKFNSKSGGSLSVTVKIPAKFQGLYTIDLMMQDDSGAKILGNFVNDPEAAPAEEPIEEPAAEPEVGEEPADDEVEETIKLVNEQPAEEPASNEPAEEPAAEPAAEDKPAEDGVEETITLVNQQSAEEPASEPAEESVVNEPAEEPAADAPVEEPAADTAEEPVIEEPAEEKVALVNQETAAAPQEEPVQNVEAAAAEIPALVCDYTKIPVVTIDAVTQNQSVTFTTADFPANSNFTVSMGVYVSTWTPDPKPAPRPHHPGQPSQPAQQQPLNPFGQLIQQISGQQNVPNFKPVDGNGVPVDRAPKPHGKVTTSFSGIEVGSFYTGDGAPQTLTFEIPEKLKGVSPIALWINDLGACGFYSYNYFYNATTNW